MHVEGNALESLRALPDNRVWRPNLGDFSGVICLKAIIIGLEDILGVQASSIALISAGRIRGRAICNELGIDADQPLERAVVRLNTVLGKDGTRLCNIERVEQDGDCLLAYTSETVCSACEPDGSDRKCTYTLGVVWGALEQLLDRQFRGTHVESVLRGASHDIFRFEPR